MSDVTFRHSLIAAVATAAGATACLLIGWTLLEFDRALFVYAETLVIALTLTVYRFSVWAHRPPTLVLYQRAWSQWKATPDRVGLIRHVVTRVIGYFALNRFVARRGWERWSAHWPVMVGCLMALGIVLPLICGWVWFESPTGDFTAYNVMVLGFSVRTIPVDSLEAFLAFHGLVWASFPVLLGCSVALWRRTRDRGDQAVQTIGNDILPLILLLAIAVTGLLMTVSYTFLGGLLHTPVATIHMVIVCGTLLWLPYSKLFHIPQRSLKLAHMVVERESAAAGRACCAQCGEEFADAQHVQDLISIQQQLGYTYELDDAGKHYQQVCPRCRRAALVLAQGARWQAHPSIREGEAPAEPRTQRIPAQQELRPPADVRQ